MMLGVTLYRNQPGIDKTLLGGVGYALTAATAVVESATALVFSAASFAISPITQAPLKKSIKWLDSSSFCAVWATVDFMINPLVPRLVADEKSARWIASTGNLMSIPPGAVLEMRTPGTYVNVIRVPSMDQSGGYLPYVD